MNAADADITIRRLSPADEPALARLFIDNNVPEVVRYFDPFPLDAETAHRLTHHEGRDLYWGGWRADQLVGLVMVRGWDDGHPHLGLGIMVDRGARGGSVGRRMLEAVRREMVAIGVRTVRFKVHPDNGPSMAGARAFTARQIETSGPHIIFEVVISDH